MPTNITDPLTIKTTIERETWAWVSAEATRQGVTKGAIVQAALQSYRATREEDARR